MAVDGSRRSSPRVFTAVVSMELLATTPFRGNQRTTREHRRHRGRDPPRDLKLRIPVTWQESSGTVASGRGRSTSTGW